MTKVLSLGFDGFDTMAMCVGFFDPSNPLVQLNSRMHASVLYNGLQVVVNGAAIFTGAAAGTMKCFVAGTLVLTLSGLAAIETIHPGDMVEATDVRTMERRPKKVLETYVRETMELVVLTVGGEILRTTPDHPFYVKGKGFLGAGELTAGDRLLDAEGQVLLVEDTKREQLEEPVKVYNFQVEDFHTYHVGECGVLVHNANYGNESGRNTATTIDYSYKFDRELANFNDGYEIKTIVDKDLILVQYSSDAPDASLCYWTTVDEANGITTLNDYMDKLALSKDWGNRNTVKVARIPAGTEVKHAVGTAREQLLIADPRPGGGVQYLFNQFDTDWITEIRSFSN